MFLAMAYSAYHHGFWNDEMASIGYIRSDLSLGEMFHYYQTIEASNLPLYPLTLFLTYRLLPATPLFMLMPGILAVLAGLAVLFSVAQKHIGRTGAMAMLLCAAVSTTVYSRTALQLRCYAFMFLFTILTLDGLLKYIQKNRFDAGAFIYTSLSMTGLLYSHFFGDLLLAFLGLGTLLYILLKKKPLYYLAPFGVAGLLFLPWFITSRIHSSSSLSDFWIGRPSLMKLPDTLGYLMGGNLCLLLLYGLSFILLALRVIRERNFFSLPTLTLVIPPSLLLTIFLSAYIPGFPGSLYENRYFLVLLPLLLLTLAYGTESLFRILTSIPTRMIRRASLCIAFLLFIITLLSAGKRNYEDFTDFSTRYEEPARELAEFISGKEDRSLVVFLGRGRINEVIWRGWYDYFFARQGRPLPHVEFTEDGYPVDYWEEHDLSPYDTVYVFADYDYEYPYPEGFEFTFQDDYLRVLKRTGK